MRLAIFLCIASVSGAQAPPADKQELYRMLDDIRGNVRSDNWNDAWRQASKLSIVLLQRMRSQQQTSPDLELRHLELLAGTNPTTRGPLLARMAKAAYASGAWDKAERYANEALEAAKVGVFWWTGDAIHQGNIVLGRLALDKRDIAAAKRDLLAAGKAPGSATLASTGPNMGLANELLRLGEVDTVWQYLDECGQFWTADRGKLAEWKVLIRAGLKPDFGLNLNY
jgi:hypothetical protein